MVPMDITQIVCQLRAERNRLNTAIQILEGTGTSRRGRGRPRGLDQTGGRPVES